MSGRPREKNDSEYDDLFVRFSGFVEKWLKRALYVLLSFLIVFQLLLQIPALRYYLVKVEQMEGIPYNHSK
ncbi:hypothetical protein [Paenibacillus sp. RC67]|uniref:hypothetical protein n=1 Tax=Paenibacillus sp. RC67 TaxID=3039392 RepID=UPI0024AD047E|nr:hypothetical protein [Paenibacillus sp. RC67]